MKILAKPGLASTFNQASSPQCLYKNVKRIYKDVDIVEWTPFRMIFTNYDILHVHWPDNILGSRYKLIIFLKILLLISALKIVRFKGSKVIWTSHNIKSHHKVSGDIEDLFWRNFLKQLDGIIAPSQKIRVELFKNYPQVKKIPNKVTYFGGWDDLIPNESDFKESRNFLGIRDDNFLIIWIGGIRRYKGIENLIESFKQIQDPNLRLLIAGIIIDSEYESEISHLTQNDNRILLKSGFVPNENLQYYYNAANLAVFPFTHVTNSGSVRLALHFNCPVLVPDFPIFQEMEQNFGSHFVKLYPHNEESITKFVQSSIQSIANNPTVKVEWGDWDWEKSAKLYYGFCKEMINLK